MFSYAYSRLFMTRWANTGIIPGASWVPLNGGSFLPARVIFAAALFVVAVFSSASAGSAIEEDLCPNVVCDWNNAALAEVRESKSLRNGPPIVARALAIAHTCMYDAWAAYDDIAVGTTDIDGTRRRPANERTDENKAKAISFAAYRCLRNLYPDGSLPPPLAQPSVRLNTMQLSLGYSLNETCNTDQDCRNSSPETAAGLGNIAAQAVIDGRRDAGSNQYGDLTPAPSPVPTPWPLPCPATPYGQTSARPTLRRA